MARNSTGRPALTGPNRPNVTCSPCRPHGAPPRSGDRARRDRRRRPRRAAAHRRRGRAPSRTPDPSTARSAPATRRGRHRRCAAPATARPTRRAGGSASFPNLYPIVGGDGAGPGARRARGRGALARPPRARSASSTTTRRSRCSRVLRDRVRTHLEHGPAVRASRSSTTAAPPAHRSRTRTRRSSRSIFVPPEVDDGGTVGRRARRRRPRDRPRRRPRARHRARRRRRRRRGSRTPSASPCMVRARAPIRAGARFDQTDDDALDAVRAGVARRARAPRARARRPAVQRHRAHRRRATASACGTGTSRSRRGCRCVAGFEMATGILVNTTPAEQAIALVRDATSAMIADRSPSASAPRSTRRVATVWSAVERIESHTEWMQDAVSIDVRERAAGGRRHGVRVPDARRAAVDHRPLRGDAVGAAGSSWRSTTGAR